MKRQHTVEYFINGCRVKAMRVDTAAEAEALVGGANGLTAAALFPELASNITAQQTCAPESSRVATPLPCEETQRCLICNQWVFSARMGQHYAANHVGYDFGVIQNLEILKVVNK